MRESARLAGLVDYDVCDARRQLLLCAEEVERRWIVIRVGNPWRENHYGYLGRCD